MLSPEFIIFGITSETYEPWTPEDSFATARVLSFFLTNNFKEDYKREVLRQTVPEIDDLIADILSFNSDNMVDIHNLIDDDDELPESLKNKFKKSLTA